VKKKNLSKLGKEKADHVVEFITRYCTHTKGKWTGQSFTVLPWQQIYTHIAIDHKAAIIERGLK
jgi:phage terminase large subunit-like protein